MTEDVDMIHGIVPEHHHDAHASVLRFGSFNGGPAHGMCLQLTIGGHFVQLDREGGEKLRAVLTAWLAFGDASQARKLTTTTKHVRPRRRAKRKGAT